MCGRRVGTHGCVKQTRVEVVTLDVDGWNKIRALKMGIGCHMRYGASADAAAGPVRGTSSGSQNSTRPCLR